MLVTDNHTCIICQIETVGEYCHQCGQRNTRKRLRLVTFVKDVLFSLFDLERSGLATFLLLIKTPSKVIHNYWEGYRKYYEAPGKLMAFSAVIIGLHIILHDNLIFGLNFTDSPQWFFLIFFLFILTISSYLTYLKLRGNFLEHAVTNIYLFCTWATILIILYEVSFYFTKENMGVSATAMFGLIALMLIWTARTFCKNKSWIIIALSALAQLVVLSAFLAFLILLMYTFTDGEISFG